MNFMQGSYGFDLLSVFLILLSFLFNIWYKTRILGSLLVLYVLYRAFSKNIYKRKREYDIFYSYASKFLSKLGIKLPYNSTPLDFRNVDIFINNLKYKFNQKRQFKITKCPYCGQKLRLPRGKGNITVTCKKCLKEFKLRT
jgi:hypothetical protein